MATSLKSRAETSGQTSIFSLVEPPARISASPDCERLMGFPDGYTDVPYRGRANAPDGPRYKVLGNSKATNCIGWIGERIDAVQRIIEGRKAA